MLDVVASKATSSNLSFGINFLHSLKFTNIIFFKVWPTVISDYYNGNTN